MNGLGIVLEEPELRSQSSSRHLQPSAFALDSFHNDTEALLPPLPDENPASLTAQSLTGASPSSLTLLRSATPPEDGRSVLAPLHSQAMLNDVFSLHLDGLLDAQALNHAPLADPFALAPAQTLQQTQMQTQMQMQTQTYTQTQTQTQTQNQIHDLSQSQTQLEPQPLSQHPQPSPTQTSPLKRLRNGIRKLSLSKSHVPTRSLLASSLSLGVNNTIAAASALTASAQLAATTLLGSLDHPVLRPHLTPLQTDPASLDGTVLSSNSLSSSTFSSQVMSSNIVHNISSTSTTPQEQTQLPNYNCSMSLIAPKNRSRGLSNSNVTSSTPSLPLPVIMLSDNLSSTKVHLLAVEQSFFDSLCSNTESSFADRCISNLQTSDELIEYLQFLNQHKASVISAYEATKECLSSSGWCSSHDLENLSLQRDSALSQIDTKLLQIEEQLNSRFQLSVLKNSVHKTYLDPVASQRPREASLSPSLKVLESRCFSFALPHE